MAEVKWIKITTDIFDDEKILLIESLPERDSLLVIWFKLLCMAGRQNNSGVFMLNDRIAYTDEMLATIFRRPLNTVRLALTTFESYGMIEIIDNVITIPKWEKHQNIDGMEKIKEQNRARVAKHREKQKLLALNTGAICQYCGGKATGTDHIVALSRGGKDIESNKIPCCIECNRIKNDKPLVDFLNKNRDRINDEIVTSNSKLSRLVSLCNVTNHYIVMLCNATDKDKEEDKEKDKDNNILSCSDEQDCSKSEIYKTIIAYLNEKAGTNYRSASKKTQSCINARTDEGFTVDDFKVVIDKKCEEWLSTDFAQYLRPSTLFGTKFEAYLNAPTKTKPQTTEDEAFIKKIMEGCTVL